MSIGPDRFNPQGFPAPKKTGKAKKRALTAAGGVVAFAMGFGLGGGTADPTTTDEYVSVSQELHKTQQELESAEAEAAQLKTSIENREEKLTELASEVEEREKDLEARENDVAKTLADIEKRESAVSETEARGFASTQKTLSKPSNVYYKNCTAARDAGAAPVRRGDPGYGSHLDRDGDGVGCE